MKRKILSDEEQHVLAFLVAEILGHGEPREADPGARAGRLVHLTEDQRDLRFAVEVDDPGVDHLVIEVVALAGPLADAGEDRNAAVGLGDIVDQLLDQHRLADAGAAEEADLAALGIGRQQVDDLDPGDQDLGFGRLIDEVGRRAMDRRLALGLDRAAFVDRAADDVEDAAQGLGSDGHLDGPAGVDRLVAADETVGGVHGDRAHRRFAQMLGHFEHQMLARIVDVQGVQNCRQIALELDVDHRAHDLRDLADIVGRHRMTPTVRLSGAGVRPPRRPR